MLSATEQTGEECRTAQSSLEIHVAERNEALAVWPLIQARVRKALTRACGDRLSERELIHLLAEQHAWMMVAVIDAEVVGALILLIEERDAGKSCLVLASSGVDHRRWSCEMDRHLRAWARDKGCYCVEAYCADGVARVMQSYGWRRKATVMEIEL